MANDFLGRMFRPANRPSASSQLKSSIWLRRSLSSSFSASRDSSAAGGGDHLRAGISRLGDEPIEAELGQQRQEEEDARDACPQRTRCGQIEEPPIGDGGLVGAVAVLRRRAAREACRGHRGRKGGDATIATLRAKG